MDACCATFMEIGCACAAAQVFADYKTRGPVILKPSDTAELIEKLEDSQMQLGSMATNRYVGPAYEYNVSCVICAGLMSYTCCCCIPAFACWLSLG
jgi:hypothetical protein